MNQAMSQPLPISVAVDIDAAPDRVWSVVSDFARMAEWSPECRRIVVLGKRQTGAGTQFLGVNRRGWVVWTTTSKIVRFEPSKVVAWKTRGSGATWTYELERTGSGTRLTGRRDLSAFTLVTKVFGPLIGGAMGHDDELTAGIRTTLERIKAAVESAAPAQQ